MLPQRKMANEESCRTQSSTVCNLICKYLLPSVLHIKYTHSLPAEKNPKSRNSKNTKANNFVIVLTTIRSECGFSSSRDHTHPKFIDRSERITATNILFQKEK